MCTSPRCSRSRSTLCPLKPLPKRKALDSWSNRRKRQQATRHPSWHSWRREAWLHRRPVLPSWRRLDFIFFLNIKFIVVRDLLRGRRRSGLMASSVCATKSNWACASSINCCMRFAIVLINAFGFSWWNSKSKSIGSGLYLL